MKMWNLYLMSLAMVASLQPNLSFARSMGYSKNPYTYEKLRNDIMESEREYATGGRLYLTQREFKANNVFMTIKDEEVTKGFTHPDSYPPGMHFFKAKPIIRESKIFRIIQKMPKGSFLHGHNTGMVSSKWVVRNLTHQYNVISCKDSKGLVRLSMRNISDCVSPTTNICADRQKAPDKKEYDRKLEKHINLYTMNPEAYLAEPFKMWDKFEEIFDTVGDFYKYAPVFRAYHTRMLEELYEDGILYAEIRFPLSSIYEGKKKFTPIEVAEELEKIVEDFKVKHPDFIGMKVIYAKRNKSDKTEMAERIKAFKELFAKKPNFIIGFDLIGNEDIGDPLHTYVDELAELPRDANFFFHAGETKWLGKTDWNLLDAILMNTRRIGHGYALAKHPKLWETVKKRGIGLEICPLSNQILGLVWDLRNHPASMFMSEDLPIVIAADDPGMWNSKALSYDFYYAFMSFASVDADLRTLKQLALNSIKYSVLTKDEERQYNEVFNRKWEAFIDDIIAGRF